MDYGVLIKHKKEQIYELKRQEAKLNEEIHVLEEQQQADEKNLHAGDTIKFAGKTGILTNWANGRWNWKAFKKDGTPEKREHSIWEWKDRKIEKVEGK